jgi:predicted DNA-binding transcriptional regulator AlpA
MTDGGKPSSVQPEELLPNHEAARLLGVKPSATVMWRHQSCGPAYVKVGRLVYYRRADIARWLAAQVCDPEAAGRA